MNQLLPALKIVAEYYPGRLCKAFVIDPPSLFAYLWKVTTIQNPHVPSFGSLPCTVFQVPVKLKHCCSTF